MKKNFQNRQIVIENTLQIESVTSSLIKSYMGFEHGKETKTLDNKSSSLSLKSKIDILYDFEKIDKIVYTNLLHILSMRNQFAHNYQCINFMDLPKYIDGIEKPLLKFCDTPIATEENLKNGFISMYISVSTILLELLKSEVNKGLAKEKLLIIQRRKTLNVVCDMYKIVGIKNRKIFRQELEIILTDENIASRINDRIKIFIQKNPSLINHS